MGTKRLKVLLVEDNPGDATLVEHKLNTWGSENIELAHADRLSSGLEQLDGDQYDAVLLDLSLPDSQGLETLEKAREHAKETPIVILSGNDDDKTALMAVQQGAQDYLIKDQMDAENLKRSIQYAIARQVELAQSAVLKQASLNHPQGEMKLGLQARALQPYQPSDFRPTPLAQPDRTATAPTQLPKPAKGRWFVGTILMTIVAIVAYLTWNSFLRYQAYGTIVGRTIDVPVPWDGIVKQVHVEEGQIVKQGDLLMTVENLALQQQLAGLEDKRRVLQAELEAKISELKWKSGFHRDRYQEAAAEYYDHWASLLDEQAKLADLSSQLERSRSIFEKGTITNQQFDAVAFRHRGQQEKVSKLAAALVELKKRMDQGIDLTDTGADQARPFLAKLEAVKAEHERIQKMISQGDLRAPTSGRVIKRHQFAGEYGRASEAAFSILEESSLQIVLFVRQGAASRFETNAELTVAVEPDSEQILCRIIRIGDRLQHAPAHIARNYRVDENLLPVYLQPLETGGHWRTLKIGGTANLPADW
jgi:DNA-binding NarL/FixJ family response regulator/multidrug resistance efflux pump